MEKILWPIGLLLLFQHAAHGSAPGDALSEEIQRLNQENQQLSDENNRLRDMYNKLTKEMVALTQEIKELAKGCDHSVLRVPMIHKASYPRVSGIILINASPAMPIRSLTECHAVCDKVACGAFAIFYESKTCVVAESYKGDGTRILTIESVKSRKVGYYVAFKGDHHETKSACFGSDQAYGKYLQEEVLPWLFPLPPSTTPALMMSQSSARPSLVPSTSSPGSSAFSSSHSSTHSTSKKPSKDGIESATVTDKGATTHVTEPTTVTMAPVTSTSASTTVTTASSSSISVSSTTSSAPSLPASTPVTPTQKIESSSGTSSTTKGSGEKATTKSTTAHPTFPSSTTTHARESTTTTMETQSPSQSTPMNKETGVFNCSIDYKGEVVWMTAGEEVNVAGTDKEHMNRFAKLFEKAGGTMVSGNVSQAAEFDCRVSVALGNGSVFAVTGGNKTVLMESPTTIVSLSCECGLTPTELTTLETQSSDASTTGQETTRGEVSTSEEVTTSTDYKPLTSETSSPSTTTTTSTKVSTTTIEPKMAGTITLKATQNTIQVWVGPSLKEKGGMIPEMSIAQNVVVRVKPSCEIVITPTGSAKRITQAAGTETYYGLSGLLDAVGRC